VQEFRDALRHLLTSPESGPIYTRSRAGVWPALLLGPPVLTSNHARRYSVGSPLTGLQMVTISTSPLDSSTV
jgi:hypothetical protein